MVPAIPSYRLSGRSGVLASLLNSSFFRNSANLIALCRCNWSPVSLCRSRNMQPDPATPWQIPGPLRRRPFAQVSSPLPRQDWRYLPSFHRWWAFAIRQTTPVRGDELNQLRLCDGSCHIKSLKMFEVKNFFQTEVLKGVLIEMCIVLVLNLCLVQ